MVRAQRLTLMEQEELNWMLAVGASLRAQRQAHQPRKPRTLAVQPGLRPPGF